MYAKEIVSEGIKPLDITDTGERAMVRMHEYNVNQLPVTDGDKYIGIIIMEELVALKHLNDPLSEIQNSLKRPYVIEDAHLYEVMKAAIEYTVKLIPVLSRDGQYLGVITAESAMKAFANLQSVMDEGGIITLRIPVKDFQLSEIARIVESNDANILSFYSHIDQQTATIDVTLKLNTNELSAIIAAFERYEYEVKGIFHDTEYEEDVRDKYDAFMRYLDV
jgi:CBS domain-containing protein